MSDRVEPQLIPVTPLTNRYVELKDQPSAERLNQAFGITAAQLADEFADSVAAFDSFSTSQPFFDPDPDRDEGKNPKSDARTYGWAMAIKKQGRVDVEGEDELAFTYVEREVVPTRTRPASQFTDNGGKQVRVDLILANAATGRPIIAELKIATDKDPFTGLVQALAGASQLVSPQQRRRLTSLRKGVASVDREPLVDIYVLLGRFPARGRHRFDQLARATAIAEELENQSAIQRHVGCIRILALERSNNQVTATRTLPTRASP